MNIIKLNIDPLSSKAGEVLQELKSNTLNTMKFNLSEDLDKESQTYKAKVKRYKYLDNIYKVCNELNMNYVTLVISFQELVNQMKEMKLKESMEKGRLMPSQSEKFADIWLLIEEIYNFYKT